MAEKSRWSLGAKLKGLFGRAAESAEPDEDIFDDVPSLPRNDEVERDLEPIVEPVAEVKPVQEEKLAPVKKPAPKQQAEPDLVAESEPAVPVEEPVAVETPAEEPAKEAKAESKDKK